MATMAELKQGAHDQRLIRKVLSSVGFWAPYDTALPASYFTTGGALAEAPAGFSALGITEKEDAWTFAAESETEEETGHGYASAVRVDMVSATKTIAATFKETRKATLQLATGTDLSSVTPGANGEIEIIEPELPVHPYGRLIIIGSDGVGDEEWFFVREYPRVQITEVAEQTWGTGALTYGLTWTAFPDPEVGYSIKQLIGGPAASTLASEMGFGPIGG